MANALPETLPASIAARRSYERGDTNPATIGLPGDDEKLDGQVVARGAYREACRQRDKALDALMASASKVAALEAWLEQIGEAIGLECESCHGTGRDAGEAIRAIDDLEYGGHLDLSPDQIVEAVHSHEDRTGDPLGPCPADDCFRRWEMPCNAPEGAK